MRAVPPMPLLAPVLAACGGGHSHGAADAQVADAAPDAGRPVPAPAVPIQVPFWTRVVPVAVNDLGPCPSCSKPARPTCWR